MNVTTQVAVRQAANSFRTLCDNVSTLIASVQPLITALVEEAEEERKPSPGYTTPPKPRPYPHR